MHNSKQTPVSCNLNLLVSILLDLHIILLFIFLFFLKLFLILFPQPKGHAIHPHNYGHVFDMVHLNDIIFSKPFQCLADSLCQQLLTLFIRIRHHKTVHMHQRHFSGLHVFSVVSKYVQKLDCVHWQIHVEMIRLLEVHAEGLFLSVEFAHDLPRTHVGANHFVGDVIELGVVDEVLVAVWIKVVGDHVESLACGSYCQWATTTEYIGQALSLVHHFQQTIPFLLQSGTPIHLLKIKLKLRPHLFQLNQIILHSRHHLQRRSTVHIMQLLGFVDHTCDVETFQQSYLTNDLVVRNLF